MENNHQMSVLVPCFSKYCDGLVPVIVQDKNTSGVLMLAYIDKAGFRETLETGFAVFFSRSRKDRWKKGETSGNVLSVEKILVDCDGDALVSIVSPAGPACHTGKQTCFYRNIIGSISETKEGVGCEILPVHQRIAGVENREQS